MFVGNIASNTIDKIKSFGVIVYNMPEKYIYKNIIISDGKFMKII